MSDTSPDFAVILARVAGVLEGAELPWMVIGLPAEVEDFVRDTWVLPVADGETGVRVDLIFSDTPYESQALERAEIRTLKGQDVRFATAEDLVLHKLFAGRPRDLDDVAGVVRRQKGDLDESYLRHWAAAFREVPGRERISDQLEEILADG